MEGLDAREESRITRRDIRRQNARYGDTIDTAGRTLARIKRDMLLKRLAQAAEQAKPSK